MAADAKILAKFVIGRRLRGLSSGDQDIDVDCGQLFTAHGPDVFLHHSEVKIREWAILRQGD
jgi:hypothetical protein